MDRILAALLGFLIIVLDFVKAVACVVGFSVVAAFRYVVPDPRKSVDGQVVVITGAANGLGRCLARNFAELGAKVVLWDVDEKSNLELQKELRRKGRQAWAYKVDVSAEKQVEEVGYKVIRDVGEVNILINNAAVMSGMPIMLLNSYQILKTMEVNVLAHFWTTRFFLPRMMESGRGHLVAVASVAGYIGCANLSDYCASKHAVIGFMSSLREDLQVQAKNKIHLTVACPPAMNTGMAQKPKTRFPSLLPICDPESIADLITDGVLRNKNVIFPMMFRSICKFSAMLPVDAVRAAQQFFDYTIEPNVR